jgi:hypothetical protein
MAFRCPEIVVGSTPASFRTDGDDFKQGEEAMEVLVHAIPRSGVNLKATIERRRREKAMTFTAARRNRWVHEKYPGWIWVTGGAGGVLTARVCGKGDVFPDRILEAFTGFVLRHLREDLLSLQLTLVGTEGPRSSR